MLGRQGSVGLPMLQGLGQFGSLCLGLGLRLIRSTWGVGLGYSDIGLSVRGAVLVSIRYGAEQDRVHANYGLPPIQTPLKRSSFNHLHVRHFPH